MNFSINRKSILFAIIFIPITLMLGQWQLDRAYQKKQEFAAIDSHQYRPAVAIELLQPDSVENYVNVKLEGTLYGDRSFLLDNQIHQGRAGYQLLTAMQLKNRQWVLVNRGWLPAPTNREQLPSIDRAAYATTLEGSVYYPKAFMFDANQVIIDGTVNDWPKRIQTIDIDLLSSYFEETLFAYTIRIHPDSPWAKVADWQLQLIPPQRHYGYAFQWFALSLVLLVMTLIANFKPLKKSKAS